VVQQTPGCCKVALGSIPGPAPPKWCSLEHKYVKSSLIGVNCEHFHEKKVLKKHYYKYFKKFLQNYNAIFTSGSGSASGTQQQKSEVNADPDTKPWQTERRLFFTFCPATVVPIFLLW
jgi:hypothetical protein